MDATDPKQQYEAAVHTLKGVHTMAYFDDLDRAHAWVMKRYEECYGERAAVIYDQRQGRKRVLVIDKWCLLGGAS